MEELKVVCTFVRNFYCFVFVCFICLSFSLNESANVTGISIFSAICGESPTGCHYKHHTPKNAPVIRNLIVTVYKKREKGFLYSLTEPKSNRNAEKREASGGSVERGAGVSGEGRRSG